MTKSKCVAVIVYFVNIECSQEIDTLFLYLKNMWNVYINSLTFILCIEWHVNERYTKKFEVIYSKHKIANLHTSLFMDLL